MPTLENKCSLLSDSINALKESGELQVEQAKLRIVDEIVGTMNHEAMTKADLARKLDKSRAYVTQILQGDVNFTVESLVKIATCMDYELKVQFVRKQSLNHWVKGVYSPVEDENTRTIEEEVSEPEYSFNKVDKKFLAFSS